VPAALIPILVVLAVVGNGLGFLFLRWPEAGAKSLRTFPTRWFMPFRIGVRTARLFGLEMAVAGLACTAGLVYAIVVGAAR
jgi:hypothetical protein